MPIERLEKEFNIAVEWKAFELHPELPAEGLPREALVRGEYFRRAEENVRRLAAEVGLEMVLPAVISNTGLAHQVAELARDRGSFAKLHRRLFEAYFQQGLNIGDTEVLLRLGGEAGLDGEEALGVLAERRYDGRSANAAMEAALLGIRAVPTFLIGDRRVVGAQPYEVLKLALLSAGAMPLAR